MVVATSRDSKDYLAIASELAAEFARTAVERDVQAGVATHELDRLRESGLLKLLIPEAWGGWGQNWITGFKVIREIAKADGSLGQLLGYHYFNVIVAELFGTPDQKAHYYAETARNNWYWADAVNPRDPELVLTVDGENFRLNGTKGFSTGTTGADIISINAIRQDLGNLLFAAVPTDREGITNHDDWDYIGQRQSDSGSITFTNVLVYRHEVFGNPDSTDPPSAFTTLITPIVQAVFANFYLGIALGAFEEARQYTLSSTRPWIFSPAQQASHDPYIVERYGDLWVNLAAATSHAEYVSTVVQAAWDKGEQLTAAERGEVAVTVATLKVLTTNVALETTSKIFEVTGTRSAASKYRFDRFWRNVRTHTLHDPVFYKSYEVGNWVLNQQIPIFTLYT